MNLSIPNFPNSVTSPFEVTSSPNVNYNCISWAYGVNNIKMWPSTPGFFWSDNIKNDINLNSFIDLFESIGYSVCENDSLENGFLKILK